ncbi:MAG TPA: hypothetical protein PKO21_04785 [Verrucomicrobiota bacterium]|nr:hypothetical protein [Verrucomicrobiota bacterium]
MKSSKQETAALSFEQQPRESNKAFAAFKTYLELGAQRSLAVVAVQHGKSKTMIERWSRRFDWPARVQAHAAHLATIEREAIEGLALEKAVDWNKVHEAVKVAEWQRHKKLIALADEMLARWEKNKAKCGTLEGIARVLELATKLGRLAAGMPTEVKEVNTTVKATIDVDWEIAIRKAYSAKVEAVPEQPVIDVQEAKP